ncbi:sulfotransferase family protein [Campylobacter sp. RM5004]|uniref:sulfotransferase family 2 domain-containing protein n=1 Tax=Campylobacter sp. RM5004 TaxID=1660078 RepID=UPI001EFA9618|nr:sulfotransferase family 2 domain-containing protein [Campylobacter sp. RM5004]ULO01691.1 sulfotransferase family protein [Campylobacter sp. RM5004]
MTQKELQSKFNISYFTMNYLLNISSKYKYIYFETPKVACSTIKRTLQELEDIHNVPRSPHDKINSPLKSPLDIESGVEIFDEYFKFSFVRNPYTRILSCYLQKFCNDNLETRLKFLSKLNINKDIKLSFNDFLKALKDIPYKKYDIHYMPQYLLLGGGNLKLDYIGKFERFDIDFQNILFKIIGVNNLSISNIIWHKTNANTLIDNYLDDESIKMINEIYSNDFLNYDYSFK